MAEEILKGLVGAYVDETKISTINEITNSLIYRGYAVQDLAAQCRFEEVAYLLWHGELPSKKQLEAFMEEERSYRDVSANVMKLCEMFPKEAHPMATLRTAVSYIGTEDKNWKASTLEALHERSLRLMAEIPTIVAATHRLRMGKKPIAPRKDLGFAENFFNMYFGEVPEKEIIRCFNISLILYAEHGFNVSTFTARTIASSLAGMYSAVTGAIGSLKGPLHGGANEEVMHMMNTIGDPSKAKAWLQGRLERKEKIMGFGHRVYKNGDSRLPIMEGAFRDVAKLRDGKKLLQMYDELKRFMLNEKGIHPNLDFPSGPAYDLMGFDIVDYTPIFVMSRITGWTAHVIEQLSDNKLIRPLAVYKGKEQRPVIPLSLRAA